MIMEHGMVQAEIHTKKDGVCVCDKVVCERWCVTKRCVKDGVAKDGV